MSAPLSWFGIVRLGLVQTALGAIIVLTTSTLNRVMVVELALPALIPGALVAWHYALQSLRPRWGHGADATRRVTPLILAGMAVLATGGALAAVATALMATSLAGGLALAVLAFTLIGGGVGAAGTSLLVLLTKRVAPDRRVAAATIVWLMMIAGFAVTTGIVGRVLDPFTLSRLVLVVGAVSVIALMVSAIAVLGLEGRGADATAPAATARAPFRIALAEVWHEPTSRLFAIFVFVSMLGYAAQDLILEPFAGIVFAMTPGETTSLSGAQHGGVFAGMVFAAVFATALRGRFGPPQLWAMIGCLASAVALVGLVMAGRSEGAWPLTANVAALGFANGVFAASAIASMMAIAATGTADRVGTRMGVFGAAQALGFGLGGTVGAAAADLVRVTTGSVVTGYTTVFAVEAALFVVAAILAIRVAASGDRRAILRAAATDEGLALASGRG